MKVIIVLLCLALSVYADNFQLCNTTSCSNNCTTISSGVCTAYGDHYFIGTFVEDNKFLNFTAYSDNLCSVNITNTPMMGTNKGACGSFGKEYNMTVGFTVSESHRTLVNVMLLFVCIGVSLL